MSVPENVCFTHRVFSDICRNGCVCVCYSTGEESPPELRGLRQLPAMSAHLQPGSDLSGRVGSACYTIPGVSIQSHVFRVEAFYWTNKKDTNKCTSSIVRILVFMITIIWKYANFLDIYIADYGWVTRFGMTFTENSQNFSLGSRTSWATESPHTSRAFPKKEQPRALQWRLKIGRASCRERV